MLIIEGISSSYDQVRVLSGVSLNIKGGEVLGLLGRNGAGKSTLLKSIMGLVKIDEGTIKLDDVVLSQKLAHEIPECGIGYIPQGRRLFPELTVGENLKMGLYARNSSNDVLDWALSFSCPENSAKATVWYLEWWRTTDARHCKSIMS